MDPNPSSADHHRTTPPPPQQPAYPYSPMPENQPPAAPQGFLPFYHPNVSHQFFRGFLQSNAGGGFQHGGIGPSTPSDMVKSFAPAAAAANQGELGALLGKPLTAESKEAKALEIMSELESFCRNPSTAAAPPPPSAATGSDSEDEDIAEAMEGAMKQLMDAQHVLHNRLVEKLDTMEKKRREMEDEWREMQLERFELMKTFREKDMALSLERQDIIIAYLERMISRSTPLPPQKPPQNFLDQRWPNHEVDKLIDIRTSLEPRFRGSGCKLSIWEEISRLMGEAGYERPAIKCKEKWENMNKYFKRIKRSSSSSSPAKRAKKCQYYEKLDLLYSKASSGCSNSDANGNGGSQEEEGFDE